MATDRDPSFRKEAMNNLSSPDQRDQLIRQPALRYWIGLIGIFILVGIVMIWLFMGSIHVDVHGEGILVNNLTGKNAGTARLEAVVFVPLDEGKKIKPGMVAYITPVTQEKDEFASVRGQVTSVSDWPVSRDNMTEILNNPDLADHFVNKIGYAPFVVYILLEQDPDNPGSYARSGVRTQPVELEHGLPCSARITVRMVRPDTLVFP